MRPNTLVLLGSALLAIVSFWLRNPLPTAAELSPPVLSEPLQQPVRATPQRLSFADTEYEVEPLYEYELAGVIVSYRYHDQENSSMHRWSNDHLNLLDLCIVWGGNAGNPALDEFSFWNGLFTCNYRTRDQAAWEAFNEHAISNNHLISADSRIREQLRGLKVGDQIRLRGYLARYGALGQPKRETSTTRTDSGNGACETLLVEDVEVLSASFSAWRALMYLSALVCAGALLRHFFAPHRPYRNGR